MKSDEILDFDSEDGKLIVYERYLSLEDSFEMIEFLKLNNFKYVLEDIPEIITSAIAGSELLAPKYLLKVSARQVDKINHLLDSEIKANLTWLREQYQDHYIHEYTKEELLEIVEKPEEWNRTIVILAKDLLMEQGAEKELKLAELKSQEILERTEIEAHKDPTWFALMVFAALGFLGILTYWAFNINT